MRFAEKGGDLSGNRGDLSMSPPLTLYIEGVPILKDKKTTPEKVGVLEMG